MGSIELKRLLRSIGRSLASWPIVGRFVRITIHLTRLPEFREATLEANARVALLTHQAEAMSKNIGSLQETLAKQQALEHELSALRVETIEQKERGERAASTAADIAARLSRFENDQIPNLLATISELNHRQLSDKKDIDNLVQSFPISLRSIKRDVVETRQSLSSELGNLGTAVEENRRSIEARFDEFGVNVDSRFQETKTLQQSLEAHIAAFDQRLEEHVSQTWDGIINEANKTRDALSLETQKAVDSQDALQHQFNAFNEGVHTLIHDALEPLQAQRTDMEDRLAQLASRNATSSDEYDTLRHHLDAINQSTEYLLNRVEFIRREVMFEMRYGAGNDEKMDDVEPEIVYPEKLKVARKTGLKLNLGCGHIALDDYINVDRRKLPGVDIVAEIDALPLKKGEATEIFSAHVLEHFPQEQLKRELLPYWVDLLKKGGKFRAVVPDAEAMTQHYAKGDYPYDDFREVMYGSQDYDGDFHYNMFTPDSLTALLEEAGLKDVELIESGRKNGACYEFEILARK
tara:strand:- start:31982 stop:33544 length:1563 start_codon:yes stop_codon:yes gene_type:complete